MGGKQGLIIEWGLLILLVREFLPVFDLLSMIFVRMHLTDLPLYPSFKDTSSPRSSYVNAKREEVLNFWPVFSI